MDSANATSSPGRAPISLATDHQSRRAAEENKQRPMIGRSDPKGRIAQTAQIGRMVVSARSTCLWVYSTA